MSLNWFAGQWTAQKLDGNSSTLHQLLLPRSERSREAEEHFTKEKGLLHSSTLDPSNNTEVGIANPTIFHDRIYCTI